jgi:flagellin
MPVVSTNTAANSALRFLNTNSNEATSSVGKLASGSRIVRASDDAAGLAIGTRLSADTNVLQQAASNASQGSSIVQVADGGLSRISDVLQRMKTLAAQSLSGTPTDTERGFINQEFSQLISEIDGIAQTTRFNGESLLDGTSAQFNANVDFFVGTDSSDVIGVDFASLSGSAATFDSAGLGVNASSVANATVAATASDDIDTAIEYVSEARANAGAYISRFEYRSEQIATSLENIQAANSSIMDVDLAAEQSRLVSSQVLVQAAVSALSQANQIPQSLLRVLQ